MKKAPSTRHASAISDTWQALPIVAAIAFSLFAGHALATTGYKDGFSQSIFMGHSFFRPGAQDLEVLAPYCGYARHTQYRQSAGGSNGDPGSLWRDTGENEHAKAEIKKGNVEILGLTFYSPEDGDSDYEDYKTWIDFTLQYNAERFDTFFIMIPWIPYSNFGTYTENRATQDFLNAHIDSLIQQLRDEYPQLTCLSMPVGEAMPRLWELFDQGQLGPEIHGVYQLNGSDNYLQRDPTGHAGHIMLDIEGLIWQQTIYPETDIRTVTDLPTYAQDWTYDIRQLAYDIWQNYSYAHRYNDTSPDPTAPSFFTNPVVEAGANENQAYSDATLADNASDDNDDPLTFAKVAGPAWLSVATDGALSGTPRAGDLGLNAFTVSVSDGIFDAVEATLQIDVSVESGANSVPVFRADPFSAPDATAELDYHETIAGSATDADGDPLTYSKVGGDAWLSIAPDGALSGTPNAGFIGDSYVTVMVSDDQGGSDQATLQIVVHPGNVPPVIDSFESVAQTSVRDIEISITEHDVDGTVTGWLISEDPTPPAIDDVRWQAVRPSSYSIQSALSVVELYAWVHDDQSAISQPASLLLDFGEPTIFSTAEIRDESTLEAITLQDWHPAGATRQKLVEINVAEWWPGQDYRIPVRLIVPLEGKATGFRITGAHTAASLSDDTDPSAFDAQLLTNGVGIVKTVVKPINTIPGKHGLEQQMQLEFAKDLNPRYTTLWIWAMTLMRATTAAYAEVDYFAEGKVVGSGSSKNGVSPAVALINDERFTATCSNVAFAWASPTRKSDPDEIAKVQAANESFFAAAEAGEFELDDQRAQFYRAHMQGTSPSLAEFAEQAGMSMDEFAEWNDHFWSSACVTENWDRLMARGVDVLFQPGTHDYVAFDILWGAQNHPQLPVYHAPNGGHGMRVHSAAASDIENLEAFLWKHFFGGEPLLSPPTSSHEVIGDSLKVQVRFENGPQAESGRIWWMYDRAPAGSAPFLHWRIPEEQWADMEWDPQTGAWTVTIPLQPGASRIDFFSNHGREVDGRQTYLSSPYTRVELSPTAPNTPPAFVADPFSMPDATADVAYVQTIAGAATDADGDPLTYSKVSGAEWLAVSADGALSGTPNAGHIGDNTITVMVSDGNGGSDQATLQIVVQAGNVPPVIDSFESAPQTSSRDIEISLVAHDVDGAVTGWLISEDPTPPAIDDVRWQPVRPSSHSIQSPPGLVELYAWVHDNQEAIGQPASLLVDFVEPTIFCLNVVNTEISNVCFGTDIAASDGFDSGLDIDAPIGRGSRISFSSPDPDHPHLQTSIQGIKPVNRWRLKLSKDPSAANVIVHWDGFELEPGKALYLLPLDDSDRARRQPYDLSVAGRHISRGSAQFEVIYGDIHQGQLELGKGWNFISIPYATPQRISELFTGAYAVLRWDGRRYRRLSRDRHLLPERAYLVHSKAPMTSNPILGLPVDGEMVLDAGWQTLGPVATTPAVRQRIWTFDNASQSFVEADVFEPWKGYWAYLSQRSPLSLGEIREIYEAGNGFE